MPVDTQGHLHGPNSKEVKAEVNKTDDLVTQIMDGLGDGHGADIDAIIVSDHGMASVDQTHMIDIGTVLNMDDIRIITERKTVVYIWPKQNKEDAVS